MKNKSSYSKFILFFYALFLLFTAIELNSCVSTKNLQDKEEVISRNLTGKAVKNSRQLYNFFMANNPEVNKKLVKKLAKLYISESKAEGINSDCAFVQMCHETGFLKFGNLVTPQMHNYCGLGAINAENPGLSFKTEKLGVRAHIQHLHAYATKENISLKNKCVDPRYKYVFPRGKSPDIFGLAGTWAADKEYGNKLNSLLTRLEIY